MGGCRHRHCPEVAVDKWIDRVLLALIAGLLIGLIVETRNVRHVLNIAQDCGDDWYTPCHITGTVRIEPQ